MQDELMDIFARLAKEMKKFTDAFKKAFKEITKTNEHRNRIKNKKSKKEWENNIKRYETQWIKPVESRARNRL